MQNIRFAILGAGGIAVKFKKAVDLTEGAEVIAVGSKSADRAAAFAEKNNIPLWYSSYEEMLANPDIDAVYIATTHNFHLENIRACIAAGKHILCEKPMVLAESDAAEAFALAAEKGVFLMEAMWSKFLPHLCRVKQWITEGRIGKIESIRAAIGFPGNGKFETRLYNPELAGGGLYDIGVYPLQIVSWLVGEPVLDCKAFWRKHPVTGVDENVSVLLRYPSCDASVQCLISCFVNELMVINGTAGSIEIPVTHRGNTCTLFDAGGRETEHFTCTYENGFVWEVEETVRCIREGKLTSDRVTPEATIECARLFDVILRETPGLEQNKGCE
ncbi:MAG: Gfo/Idh/MocA family oxidoreductase [Clostridia bacterium]|nr:Gfo/Idh/MocA family oxidoreductase [Clostridia bacterium]